jgi:phosphohistidine phosphatase
MHLLIIRHAIAVPRGTPGIPDAERPLTPEGEKKFRQAARGLARVRKRPDALLTSPWRRARQTAEIAAEAWGRIMPTQTPALAGGAFEDLAAALADHSPQSTVALVGHEPHLSALLARLLGTTRDDRLTFRKGGAALLDLPGGLEEGGRLVWYVPPKILRELGA